jgi:hypothetical protein
VTQRVSEELVKGGIAMAESVPWFHFFAEFFNLRSLPHLAEDDILQPTDFPELKMNPYFRCQEGGLGGLRPYGWPI